MPLTSKPNSLTDALFHWSEKTPNKILIYSEKGNFSFQQTRTVSANLAGFLAEEKLPVGARIGFIMPRIPELIFSFLAAGLAGCLPAPVNYLETAENIKKNILSLDPAAIIVDETVIDEEICAFLQKYDIPVISINSGTKDFFFPWEQCVRHQPLAVLRHPAGPDDPAYLNFTTGSTGTPKGALCTQENLYWNTRSIAETFRLTADDVHLCMFAAFAHPHELFCRALYTGSSVALLNKLSPKAVVRTINRYGVTCMMGLAVLYKMMAAHCGDTPLPSLRIAESGGMFTSPKLRKEFADVFQVPLLSVWGSTETSGVALANTPDNHRINGNTGRVCPYYQVKIINEEGLEAQPGETGEMLLSGPAVVSGYYCNAPFPEQDGWYCSGDLAKRDRDGFYHFVERKSGMIKVAGLKVYPLQVELVLLQHPGVKDAAVVGIEEKRRGCVPIAFIVTEDGVRFEEDEMKKFCGQRLAPYMVPRQFRQLDSLPKTGSGKINKKVLLTDAIS